MTANQELVQLLCDLIALPSVNPEHGVDCSDWPYGESRVAAFVESYFRSFDVQIERQQARPGRDSVLIHVPGLDESVPPVLLEAHMDTVGGEGMEAPFTPRVQGGKVYGRGACDTKGSLAAMMFALRQLLAQSAALPRGVVLAATADEEFGMSGARTLVESGMAFCGAIVGEPTALQVVAAHDGQMYVTITAHGKAAHTSMPQHGVNAIYAMNEVIAVLRREAARVYPEREHPLCGPPKLTVSMIQGGVSEHIVPERCEIAIDFRVIPGESCQQVLEEAKAWLAEHLEPPTYQTIGFAEPHKMEPPMETHAEHALVQGILRAAADVLGHAEVKGVPYNTDASHYGAAGIPCVVFGPGGIAQAHSAVEYVEIEELAGAVEIVQRFLLESAAMPG
jgi:acetylornithine deacetylase